MPVVYGWAGDPPYTSSALVRASNYSNATGTYMLDVVPFFLGQIASYCCEVLSFVVSASGVGVVTVWVFDRWFFVVVSHRRRYNG